MGNIHLFLTNSSKNKAFFEKILNLFLQNFSDRTGSPLLDDEGNTVYSELTQEAQREAAEEFLAHLGETNGVPPSEIYLDHKAEVDAWGRLHGYDTRDLTKKDNMTRNWMADTGFRPERPSWLKRLISSIRLWLNKHGWFVHHLSDNDILTILARSAGAAERQTFNAVKTRFAVSGDENTFSDIYNGANKTEKETIEAYKYAMTGEPVSKLSGTEFQKDNIPLTEKVPAYFVEKYNGIAVNPELGEVKIDAEGVKDSLGHGIGRIKAAAYAAVPQIIEKGKICNRQKNWKDRGYDTVVIVAPVEIAGIPYVGEVVVEQRTNRQGFYLHEVEIKEKLANAFKTPTEGSALPAQSRNDAFKTANGSAQPASRLIISQLLDKIKQKYKNSSKTSERYSRYSLELDERTKNLIAMMKPLTGQYMIREPEFYIRRMQEEYHIQISEAEAKLTASLAAIENRSDARKREIRVRNEWLDKENCRKIYSLEEEEIIKGNGGVHPVRYAPSGIQRQTHLDYLPKSISKLQQKHEKIKLFLKKN